MAGRGEVSTGGSKGAGNVQGEEPSRTGVTVGRSSAIQGAAARSIIPRGPDGARVVARRRASGY